MESLAKRDSEIHDADFFPLLSDDGDPAVAGKITGIGSWFAIAEEGRGRRGEFLPAGAVGGVELVNPAVLECEELVFPGCYELAEFL